ncbi:Ultraviolet-B receptor UVR8 [Penicillium rolfsii]|nr:Ultraviolet-B receptor UVR8 [Penicillium rolfsii]
MATRMRGSSSPSVRLLLLRPTPVTTRLSTQTPWRRLASNNSKKSGASPNLIVNSLGVAVAGAAAYLGYSYVNGDFKGAWIESQTAPEKQVINVNDLRAQFIQEKRSLKSPAVYTWGSNIYKVVDPGSKDTDIKTPRRFKYFNGQVLRDFKVDEKSGAAITEDGDLIQWGKGFSETEYKPTKTLTGKNLKSVALSENRIIALSSDGSVFSLPISKKEQETGPKPRESSWVPFMGSRSALSYRKLNPTLGLGEKVTSISAGQEHVVLLTSSGRVFTAVASTEHYPSLGQLGVPGLTWSTRPQGPVDICHELTAFIGSKVTQISTGDYHSLALTKDGLVFAWGDNSFGQLGVDYEPELPYRDTPIALPLQKLYRRGLYTLQATGIAAGGAGSFFTVDAKRILGPEEEPKAVRDLGNVTADTWSCGRGIWGTLGTGRWVHLQDSPSKVKDLSGLAEYDETKKQMSPIRLRYMSVGTTHVAAVMDNKTTVSSKPTDSLDKSHDFGLDVLFWGGNEHFQLGTGKRTNLPRPSYIKAPSEASKKDEPEARLQIMPAHKGKVGKRSVKMEQRVECGRHVSAIYSAAV